MESMSVKPEQVTALSGQIRTGATGIKSQLDTLEKEIGTLRASWNGEAQSAYDEAQAEWTKSLTALQELLGTIATKTDEISSTYVSSDKSSAGRFAI
jgi:6 kDa early secretory antigenic target